MGEVGFLDELGEQDKYNTAEVYIKPPVRKNMYPGLIVKRDGECFLVITPACDVSQGNAEYYQLLKMVRLEDIQAVREKGRSGNRKEVIKNLVRNSKNRFHYLPAFGEEVDMLVDFQSITTINKEVDYKEVVPLCAIASPFFKDIVNRFSSYYARQGSPDFDAETLSDQLNQRLHDQPLK